MSLSPSQRIRAYRTRQKEVGATDSSRRNRKEHKRDYKRTHAIAERPFTGCDGEGCGVDGLGRQLYQLFRIGDRELYTGGRLGTEELLDFICDHPKDQILVGFAFGYDVTMILRDLSEGQQRKLFLSKVFEQGHSPFVWYKEFDIDYLPKQYFRVRRVKIERDPATGQERRVAVRGSTRTIYETFGFFQKSFVRVIHEFDAGTDTERKSVANNKSRRATFEAIGDEERAYCELECKMLAETMEKLRGYCYGAGISPSSWNGAGKLAGALHRLHDTPKAGDVANVVPRPVLDFANMAYYGGRFEITRVGHIAQEVFEYDIRSAYPATMRKLPCLEHGTWKEATASELRKHNGLYVAACSFKAPDKGGFGQLGGFPVRSKEGHLYWPLQGAGVYWSTEVNSARQMGYSIRFVHGWTYHRNCDCHPFDWVEPLFDYRRSIGAQGPGYPIKLGINSLYGLLAQRKGNGRFVNIVWAGLITATVRAMMNDVIALNPKRIVMIATDAIYSLDPLDVKGLDIGEKLGQWEKTVLPSLFIVQPGLYWSPDLRKKKSRGLSGKFFEEAGRTQSFEKAWKHFSDLERTKVLTDFPAVSVPVPGFVGLKLALSRNKPELSGTWVKDERSISFDYRNKRQGHKWSNDCILTRPKLGYPGLKSLPHRDFLAGGGAEPWEAARSMLEEQPDWVDFGIPYKD